MKMTKQVRAREWARKEVEFWTDSSGHLTQTPQEIAERGWKAGFEAGRRDAAAARKHAALPASAGPQTGHQPMSRSTDIISLEEFDRIARENGLNPDLFVDPSWDSSNTLAFAEHVAELAAKRGYDEGRRVQNGDKLTADEYMRLLEWSRTGKPASTAFTSGLLRDIAYLLEHVMSEQALAGRKPQDENKVVVLYDLSPLAAESVARGKLIEMGWTPPKAEQQEPVRQHRTVTYTCPVCAASLEKQE